MSGYWSKSLCSKRGWITLSANFRGNGASPTNDRWRQKTRVPGLSYGYGVVCVILHLAVSGKRVTYRRTNGRTHVDS